MRIVVVGAGPVGAVTAIGLARQGHAVTVVDRDPGPPPSGAWKRRGVMQFRHPHGFRPNVHAVLADVAPDVWHALLAEGCVPAVPAGAPPGVVGLHARRSTFERGLRRALAAEPRVRQFLGDVDEIVTDGATLVGVRVAGMVLEADSVVVATGRSGRLGAAYRAEPDGGPCGLSYTSRMYRTLPPGAELAWPSTPRMAEGQGYLSIMFPQDEGTLSVLVVRPSSDAVLGRLRHNAVFDRVVARIPNLAPWVDPQRFEPITDALPGGGLVNSYQSVLDVTGRCAVPGLLFVGDAVLTTNPQAGRGISTGLEQVRRLLQLFAEHADLADVALAFDAWAAAQLRPWFSDHELWDASLLRRWSGAGLDLDGRIPSDVVCAAAAVEPRIAPAAAAYGAMAALPQVLDPFQEITRSLLRSGWRPHVAGPTRDELAVVVEEALAPQP
jgi:2-polyprenyl-6-methoxyphenol hydroxylase-like FAD-dependent oxidoreductase